MNNQIILSTDKSKIIERVDSVIEVFLASVELATDKEIFLKKEKFGISSLEWNISWRSHSLFVNPIEIYLYGKDDWVDIHISEKAFNFTIDEDERFSKYEKKFAQNYSKFASDRIVIIRPKNKKQLQEIMQKLIKYM